MHILKLLSEEVFDFSRDTMTAAKMTQMKTSLNDEFTRIFRLCEEVLSTPSSSQRLVVVTLHTLQKFLTWIPLGTSTRSYTSYLQLDSHAVIGYIFETSLIASLISKFFPLPAYRTATIDCLTEIASLASADIPSTYHHTLKMLLVALISRLVEVVPPGVSLRAAFEEGSEEDCLFISRLALFISTYLRTHLAVFEASFATTGKIEFEEAVLEALGYALRLSEVDDDEVFKTCLELWQVFSRDLYNSATAISSSGGFLGSSAQYFSPLSPSPVSSPIVSFYEKHDVLKSYLYYC
jgi:exportin-1